MKRLVLLPIAICVGFAQTPAPLATFEAAEVEPASPFARQVARPVINGRWYEYKAAVMCDFVANAYSVDPEKVLGGPMWLEYDRYDIVGRIPQDASPDKVKEMLQSVLIDRFGLVTKSETRMMPALALTVPKKHQLKATDGSATGCKFSVVAPTSGEGPQLRADCRNVAMADFAQQFASSPEPAG